MDIKNKTWFKNHWNNLEDPQRRILIAMSNSKYEWRSKRGLLTATGLIENDLDKMLAELIERGIIEPSISKEAEDLVFRLIE